MTRCFCAALALALTARPAGAVPSPEFDAIIRYYTIVGFQSAYWNYGNGPFPDQNAYDAAYFGWLAYGVVDRGFGTNPPNIDYAAGGVYTNKAWQYAYDSFVATGDPYAYYAAYHLYIAHVYFRESDKPPPLPIRGGI